MACNGVGWVPGTGIDKGWRPGRSSRGTFGGRLEALTFPVPDGAATVIFRSRLNACSFAPGQGKSCRRAIGFDTGMMQPGLGPGKVQASSWHPTTSFATPAGPDWSCSAPQHFLTGGPEKHIQP